VIKTEKGRQASIFCHTKVIGIFVKNFPLTCEFYKSRNQSAIRRQVADIIFVRDLPSGNVDCPELLAEINIKVPSFHSRNKELSVVPFYEKNCGKNSFFPRALESANKVHLDFFLSLIVDTLEMLFFMF